jgi:hypothetical protein
VPFARPVTSRAVTFNDKPGLATQLHEFSFISVAVTVALVAAVLA